MQAVHWLLHLCKKKNYCHLSSEHNCDAAVMAGLGKWKYWEIRAAARHSASNTERPNSHNYLFVPSGVVHWVHLSTLEGQIHKPVSQHALCTRGNVCHPSLAGPFYPLPFHTHPHIAEPASSTHTSPLLLSHSSSIPSPTHPGCPGHYNQRKRRSPSPNSIEILQLLVCISPINLFWFHPQKKKLNESYRSASFLKDTHFRRCCSNDLANYVYCG